MSVEELRELIVPLFSGESSEAQERHDQFLSENPALLLNLNIENIKSGHETAQKSSLLLQREITMIGKQILEIPDQELPGFLFQNLIEILQNPGFSPIHRFISTSIARLAKYYIPSGVWPSFFEQFFAVFDESAIEVQYDFVDCLNLIISLPCIKPEILMEKNASIIDSFIATSDMTYIRRGLQLLFASLKYKKDYEALQQFVEPITAILTSGEDVTGVLHDMCQFIQKGVTFFAPDAENLITAIIQLASSGEGRIRNYAIIILGPLIKQYAQSLTENITEIFSILITCLAEQEDPEESEGLYNPVEETIEEVSKIYESDIDVSSDILSLIESLNGGESPQQMRAILVTLRIIWHNFSSSLEGGFEGLLLPIFQAALECEDEEVRYQAFATAKKALKYDNVDQEKINEFVQQILEIVGQESSEKVLKGEVDLISNIIYNKFDVQLIEPIATVFSQILESVPAIVLPIFTALASKGKENFAPFCAELTPFIGQIIEGYEELFQDPSTRVIVFKACDTASAMAKCQAAEEFEPVANLLVQFILQIDPESLSSASEKDSLNSVFGSLMDLQNTSQAVNEAFEALATKIFTEASKELTFTVESADDYEESEWKVAIYVESEREYRIYERDEVNETIEAAVALNKMLKTKTKHPEMVEAVGDIVMRWCAHPVSDNLTIYAIKAFASMIRHVNWEEPEKFVEVYNNVMKSITTISLRYSVSFFIGAVPDILYIVYEYSRKIGPDPNVLNNMVIVVAKAFKKICKLYEANDEAGNIGDTVSKLSSFIQNILGIEYAILKFHPELAEIVAPLTELLPLNYENNLNFCGGINHVSYLLQTTELLDDAIGDILPVLFQNVDTSLTKKCMSVNAVLGLIISGKLPQEAAEDAMTFIKQILDVNAQLGALQSNPMIVSTLFRTAEAVEDATPFVEYILSFIDKCSSRSYWNVESVEICTQLLVAQKSPFDTQEVVSQVIPFILRMLEECDYIVDPDSVLAAIQPFLPSE